MQKRNIFSRIKEQMARSISVSIMLYVITWPSTSYAYRNRFLLMVKRGIGNLSFQIYRPKKIYILVIGPVLGQKYSEITFLNVYFLKYPIYVGGNKGRGQIYPDRSKSNNTVYNATSAGIVSKIVRHQVVDIIPLGPELLVSEGESIKLDQPLTSNPNVGGFGQGDAKIVLQDPSRVQGLLFFLASVILA
ncbi:hypothetical protein MKX03_029719 [Papaver bracteatum]|nr:hypothetical protein MKX03_029719 [Papaver bracteatum]